MLVLQSSELSNEVPQLSGRLGLMPLLVVLVEPPCCPVQDRADDGKVLVAQFGEERVGGRGEEMFPLAGRESAERGLGGCRGRGGGSRI